MKKFHAVFYVSESRVDPATAESEVEALVALARSKNRRLQITGALAYTGDRFVQYIEGPAKAIEGLMRSIRLDPRHTNLTVVYDSAVAIRRFENWALAFTGKSIFLSTLLTDLIDADELHRPRHVARTLRLLEGLSDPSKKVVKSPPFYGLPSSQTNRNEV